MSVRPRDRSADNILLATHTNFTTETSPHRPVLVPAFSTPIQRSSSFKQPQGMTETRPILKPRKERTNENDSTTVDLLLQKKNIDERTISPARSRSSSQEHIYDNLDVFKRAKPNNNNNNLSSNEDEPSSTINVKTREHPAPPSRLRPLTMHASANNDKQSSNEFENVFNQLKKRGSIRRVKPNEETLSVPTPVEEPPPPVQPENEPIIAMNKTVETTPIPQTPNRRKTVGGVYLPASNKVATNDTKPAPSWVDIAKQKQNKL